MTSFAPHEIIPTAYRGREQAYIKHLLLEGYLERLLYIIGWNADTLGLSEVVFVDCFAGPWQDNSADLSSTSIGISLRLLSKIQKDLLTAGRHVKFRALYIERDAEAFSRLQQFLSTCSPANVATGAINGDFVEKIPDVLGSLSQNSFAFFFIDPKGWLTVRPNILQDLLKRPNSEFLINFMYDFVNRTVSMPEWKEKIAELFDNCIDFDQLPDDPIAREHYLLEKYRAAVVARAHLRNYPALSADVTILDPLIDRTKYHLLYVTRHPLGIIKFMEQSEIMAGLQTMVRTAAKLDKNNKTVGMDDFFGVDTEQTEIPQIADISHIEKHFLELIGDSVLTVNRDIFAQVLCHTKCFPSELQMAVKNLIDQGKVAIPGVNISRRRKNYINYENGEQLRSIQQGVTFLFGGARLHDD